MHGPSDPETVFVVSDSPSYEMSSYLHHWKIDLRARIQIVQARNYPEAVEYLQRIASDCLAVIVRSYRLGPYPISLDLIPLVRSAYRGPIIVIGKREKQFDWVGQALKAGASHHVEMTNQVPALLQELLERRIAPSSLA